MGINRSPTASRVAKEIAQQNGLELEADYGGYWPIKKNNTPKEHFDNYDLIIVMEDYMEKGLKELGIPNSRIRCLYIPDDYYRDDPILIKILKNSLQLYVRESPL